MKTNLKTLVLGSTLAIASIASHTLIAQEPQVVAQHDHSHEDHSHSVETVDFTLTQWKTLHFEDAAKATQHLETAKKLGCEVKQGKHSGHIDVSYRCAQWQTLNLPSHELAEQWIGWLKGAGFDVSHGHLDKSFTEGDEVVEFRAAQWKHVHGDGTDKEKELITTLTQLGCEVTVTEHSGHSDIRYRAPTWRDIHVADHAAVDQWTQWLKKNGFEVAPHKHEH